MANNNTYEQVYNVTEDESLLSRIGMVICVLVQRGLFVAGYSSSKELLTIHFTGYRKTRPVWALDFFEHLFANEPLLAARDKVKGVFICSDKHLIVPDALYDENEAKNWLKRIHFIERTDVINVHHLEDDNANYLFAAPLNITELIKINFKKAPILPLAAYHFRDAQQKSLYLQCCVMNDQVCASLHNYSQLLWHRIFSYSCAEDIAYDIKHLCVENNISPSKITLMCDSLSAAEHPVLNQLSQYFSGIRSGDGHHITTNWDPAIALAHQLLACV